MGSVPLIAVAQLAPSAELAVSLDAAAAAVGKARGRRAGVVVLPELALSGGLVDARFHERALRLSGPEIGRLCRISWHVSVVAGFIEETDEAEFFDSAVWIRRGEIRHVHRKLRLAPAAEERRYLAAGREVAAFESRVGRVAMLLGEDLWDPALPWLAAHDGAGVIVVPVARTGDGAAGEMWERLARTTAASLGCFVVLANATGSAGDGGPAFAGGSFVVGPDGVVLERAGAEPDMIVAEIDLAARRRQRLATSFRPGEGLELVLRAGQRVLETREGRAAPVPPPVSDDSRSIAARHGGPVPSETERVLW